MRIDQALQQADRLDTETPRLDVELLLMALLDCSRSYLYTWPERQLTTEQTAQFEALLAQRSAGHPIAHLTGERGFWSLQLEVNSSTLIPRPDTETLVEAALARMASEAGRVADLGTGTGAIALALAIEKPDWEVVATDRVPDAVALARRNAERHALTRVQIRLGSWFEPLDGCFDLIVSNPPYIDPEDRHLERGDLRFEPRSALTAAERGLADLRYLIDQAPAYLKPGGWLLLEHGYDQAAAVAQLFRARGYTEIANLTDLGGNPRVSVGRWPQATEGR